MQTTCEQTFCLKLGIGIPSSWAGRGVRGARAGRPQLVLVKVCKNSSSPSRPPPLAAPASRRLGRAGLEAPPLLGGMRETGTQEQNLKCRRGHVLRGWVTSAFRW